MRSRKAPKLRSQKEVDAICDSMRVRSGDCLSIASDPELMHALCNMAWKRYHDDPTKERLNELIEVLASVVSLLRDLEPGWGVP